MKILIADDNHFYRCALTSTLKEWGYEVTAVDNGTDALAALQEEDAPKLAILDWLMPGLDGLEVCQRIRALHQPEAPYILLLTSKAGKKNLVAALDSGADDFISKPFDREELQARLRVGRRIVGLQMSQTVVFAFARAVDAKSPYTQGHADRVANYALALAERIGLSAAEKDIIRRGGRLHDIGKICIPDAILNKPGALTREEYDIVKNHPMQGVAIVEPLESLRDAIPIIRWHHERLDGRGYPDGLKGDALPHLVRIVTIADVYDALSSVRPYREAMPVAQCQQILLKGAANGELDADLVEEFVDLIDSRTPATMCDAFAGSITLVQSVPVGYMNTRELQLSAHAQERTIE
jgi:putative two-component system response regulator